MQSNDVKLKNEEKVREEEDWKAKAEEYLNNWKRERADFVNYKRDEEKKNLESWVYMSSTLGAMDAVRDLHMAMYDPDKKKGDFKEFVFESQGISRLQNAIEKAWQLSGIRRIPVEGQKFDPQIHEAVEKEEGGDKLEEMAPGYAIGDKTIRPAKVKIIK